MWRWSPIRKWTTLAVSAAALLALATVVRGPDSASAHHQCQNTGSTLGAFTLETHEDANYRTTYARLFELAGLNRLFPEHAGFALPRPETGPASAGSSQTADPHVPPVLLKAISWLESGWAMAEYSVAYGGTGLTLTSHDCGYGLMQVTSGMQNISGIPNLDQAMIGGHSAFNVARGARILMEKWNMAPEFRPIAGARDPKVIEDWYFALWGYNGFAFSNHPLNPSYSSSRAAFSCGPENDGFGHDRTQYPYQELIFGCASRPPVKGTALWPAQDVQLPNLTDPAFATPLRVDLWNACAYSVQCAPMNIPGASAPHQDTTNPAVNRNEVIGSPVLSLPLGRVEMRAVPPATTASASVTIANTGTGVMSWRLTSQAAWLVPGRNQGVALGTDMGSRASTVQLAVNMNSLPPGTYTTTLTVESLGTQGAPAAITVVLDNLTGGGLVRGSGAPVYVITDGTRRHVPDQATFEVHGYSWSSVASISDAALNAIPAAEPLLSVLDTGNLLRGPGPEVWVMQSGFKRHVTSEAVLAACGYGWDAVMSVTAGSLAAIASTNPLTGTDCPRLSPPDGAMLKGPGPEVYVMQGGLKRHAPNLATLEARNHRWSDINSLSGSQLGSVPIGLPLLDVLTTGSLVKSSGPQVFVMESGVRRHIADLSVLEACGYGWGGVYAISDGSLAAIPAGARLTGAPCPKFAPNGGQVLTSLGPELYVVQAGYKRLVPNTLTLTARGNGGTGNTDLVDASYLTALPTARPLLNMITDGNLLSGQGPEVYVVQGLSRRHITSEAVLAQCGYRWDAISRVPAGEIATLSSGNALNGPPCVALALPAGTLLKGSGPEVWVVQAGVKRHVTSEGLLANCGYHWGNIDFVSDGLLAAAPTGLPLVSGPCP